MTSVNVTTTTNTVEVTAAGATSIVTTAPAASVVTALIEGPQGPQGPAGPDSTDEKVAVVSGGTAGYIWGADGTDGVIRLNSSLSWTKDVGNAYVTIAVDVVDGGAF